MQAVGAGVIGMSRIAAGRCPMPKRTATTGAFWTVNVVAVFWRRLKRSHFDRTFFPTKKRTPFLGFRLPVYNSVSEVLQNNELF
jgi:hypothetical protein